MPTRFYGLVQPRSYGGLLAMLVVVIVVSPVLEEIRLGSRILDVLFVLALLSVIRDIADDTRSHRWVLGVGAVAIVSRIASVFTEPSPVWFSVVTLSSTIALFLIAIWSISRHVFHEPAVSVDTIRGAVCVFLLLGFVWTMAYVVIFAFEPSAFPALDSTGDAAGTYASLQYFSFVTLTTLGYGDITPHGLIARQLAMAEAIVGQLFVAVAIAWLVGMYRGENGRGEPPSGEADECDRS